MKGTHAKLEKGSDVYLNNPRVRRYGDTQPNNGGTCAAVVLHFSIYSYHVIAACGHSGRIRELPAHFGVPLSSTVFVLVLQPTALLFGVTALSPCCFQLQQANVFSGKSSNKNPLYSALTKVVTS